MSAWAEHVRHDAGYAWRGLCRSPKCASAVVLVLVLGLGANTAIFSVIDRIFLAAPAGVDGPREIRRLYHRDPQLELAFGPANGVYENLMYPEYAVIRESAESGVQFAAYVRPDSLDIRIDNANVSTMVSYVTRSYFTTLHVRPPLGRFFSADEDRIDVASPAAVISDALWHRVFARDPAVLGKQVRIADRAYSVIGVAPRGFSGIDLDRADIWLPLGALRGPPLARRPWYQGGFGVLRAIVRVPSSIPEERVASMATVAYRRLQQVDGVTDTTSTVITGPIIAALGPTDREQEISITLRLAGVSLILLLIGVGNVANLLLVRSLHRRREIAIRKALGVSTVRLFSQLTTESLLLSMLSAAAAVIVGVWGSVALRGLLLPEIHWSSDSHFARIITFAAIASIVVGTLAGMAPAFHARGLDVSSALKSGVRSSGHRRVWTRGALTVVQVSLSIVLLVGAGLFTRSLRNVRAIDIGFDPRGLVALHAGYTDAALGREIGPPLERVARELSAVPGVRSFAMASGAPMQGVRSEALMLPGRDSVPKIDGVGPLFLTVSPEYFATLGIRRVAGRTFETSDRAGTAPVVVVSKTMARVVWPGENPIGKCVQIVSRGALCTTVVGVVDDAHSRGIVESKQLMQLYVPLAQNPPPDSSHMGPRGSGRVLLVRTRPGTEATVMQTALRIGREHLPLPYALSVDDIAKVIDPQLRPWRLGATLFSALGVLAALVAAVGVYSVLSYSASQRAHEMSIRMALGARGADIMRLVAGEGLRVVLLSIGIGIAVAVAMGRLVASLLYGVSSRDPLVLIGAAGLLALMGLAAALTPALQASRSDPARALRAE
jgi:predicted permease